MVAVVPVTFDGYRRTAHYRDHGGKRQHGWKQIFPLIGKTGYHQHGEQNSHNQSENIFAETRDNSHGKCSSELV